MSPLSENPQLDAALNLVRNLVTVVQDGAVTPDEAETVFNSIGTVVDGLALTRDKWWQRWGLKAAASALREAGEHCQDLPGGKHER